MKYETDGHLETIDPSRLTVGCVIREVHSDGSSPAFADAVVTAFHLILPFGMKTEVHDTAESAMQALQALKIHGGYVAMKIARPYLYSASIGICSNWLVGVEASEVCSDLGSLKGYKAVVMSTGEYATYNSA